MTRKTWISLALTCAILSTAALGAAAMVFFKRRPERRTPEALVTKVVAPPVQIQKQYPIQVVAYGSARPRVSTGIAPRVGGEIIWKNPNFLTGRIVGLPDADGKRGMLFRIDPEPYELAVENAKQGVALLEVKLRTLEQQRKNLEATEAIQASTVTLQKTQLERNQSLKRRGVGTDHEVDLQKILLLNTMNRLQETRNQLALVAPQRQELNVRLQAAKVALQETELNLEWTRYAAPLTGRVLSCGIEVGKHVLPGQVCGALYGTDRMEVPVAIPASDLDWLDAQAIQACLAGDPATGKTICVRVEWSRAGGKPVVWAGCVGRVEGGLDAHTRTAMLIIDVDNRKQANSGKPGYTPIDRNMYCRVVIAGRTVPEAFVLPRSAIQPDGTVFLAEDGKLARRAVTVARYTDGEALILPDGGLRQGDRVVTSYLAKPVLGMNVQP